MFTSGGGGKLLPSRGDIIMARDILVVPGGCGYRMKRDILLVDILCDTLMEKTIHSMPFVENPRLNILCPSSQILLIKCNKTLDSTLE